MFWAIYPDIMLSACGLAYPLGERQQRYHVMTCRPCLSPWEVKIINLHINYIGAWEKNQWIFSGDYRENWNLPWWVKSEFWIRCWYHYIQHIPLNLYIFQRHLLRICGAPSSNGRLCMGIILPWSSKRYSGSTQSMKSLTASQASI